MEKTADFAGISGKIRDKFAEKGSLKKHFFLGGGGVNVER